VDTEAFLRRHFQDLREGELIEIRCVPEDREKRVVRRYFTDPAAAATFALKGNAQGYHAYYGVNPRSKRAVDEGFRGKDAVARITHAWVDVDDVDTQERAAGLVYLADQFPPPAEHLVYTGGGLQVLWKLADDPGRELAEELNTRLALHFDGDEHATDISRVLRLPGTINHKPKYPPGTVAKVEIGPGDENLPNDFWPHLPQPTVTARTPEREARDVDDREFCDALNAIDPWRLSYDEWLRALMAIHAWHPSELGLGLAIEWAQGKQGEIEAKWRSFKGTGVSPATIFYLARRDGWRPPFPHPLDGPMPAIPTYANDGTDPEPAPPRRKAATIALIPLDELFQEADDGPKWVVDELLNAGGTSLLVAKQKVGKSTFAANLALSVATGTPVLGRACRPAKVHVYSLEVHRGMFKEQYRRLQAAYGVTSSPNIFVHAGTGIVAGAFGLIAELVRRDRPALVILDTLAKAVDTIKDGNDYLEVYRALQPVIELAEETGAHIVCVHHANKGVGEGADAVMGSVGFAASVDLTMLLRKDRETGARTMEFEARFLPEAAPQAFEFDQDRRIVELGDRDDFIRKTAEDRVLIAVAACPGMTQAEIKAATGLPDGIVGPAVYRLASVYRLRHQGSPRRYEIPAPASASAPAPPFRQTSIDDE
jgi:hypothetical protein